MIGITIKPTIGIGDAIQYSSLPENYYRATGERLVDLSKPWFFDYNPYVDRNPGSDPAKIVEMWNFSPQQYEFPNPRQPDKPRVYLSNAEIWASVFKVPCIMNRPRLYRFEDYPYHERKNILLHTDGISHGEMPLHIIEHVKKKYGPTGNLWHIGPVTPKMKDYGIPQIQTPTLWNFAELVSKAKMLIDVDSGTSWIAACYSDVIIKKVRTKPNPPKLFMDWVPLEMRNIHSHWDSREHMIYNVSDDDMGFTWSYRRI